MIHVSISGKGIPAEWMGQSAHSACKFRKFLQYWLITTINLTYMHILSQNGPSCNQGQALCLGWLDTNCWLISIILFCLRVDFAPYVLKFEEYKGFVRNVHLANANTKILRTIVSRQVIFLHISVLQLFWFPKGAWPPDPKATYNVLTSGCSIITVACPWSNWIYFRKRIYLQDQLVDWSVACWLIVLFCTLGQF